MSEFKNSTKLIKFYSTIIGAILCILSFVLLFVFIELFMTGLAYSSSKKLHVFDFFLVILFIFIFSYILTTGILVIKMKKIASVLLIILILPVVSLFIINIISISKNITNINFKFLKYCFFFLLIFLILFEIYLLIKHGNDQSNTSLVVKKNYYKYIGPSVTAKINNKKIVLNCGDVFSAPENDEQILIWLEFKQCVKIHDA